MNMYVVGRSVSATDENKDLFRPENIRKDLTIMSGKAAGICYMPDDYLSEGVQNENKALVRADLNASSGHHSTYEHGHINFIIECNKIMCMILNSMGLYSTSEKSSRYTAMHPQTELEQDKYNKWKDIFIDLIQVYYKDIYDTKRIEKLAMENARYMISVFTPTVMEYTIPFDRAILTPGWLDTLAENITKAIDYNFPTIIANTSFYKKIHDECKELAELFRKNIGITKSDHILDDHKKIGIELFSILSAAYKLDQITDAFANPEILFEYNNENDPLLKSTYYGDSYTTNYQESLAGFAQSQRHRTLRYSINLPKKLDCYVPKIIKSSTFEIEWRKDYQQLIDQDIIPQATLVDVCEQGRFEDFILKCKERLCSRAQLEIMEVTRDQLTHFATYKANLGLVNRMMLQDMIEYRPGENPNSPNSIIVKPRCQYACYKCKEPCGQNPYMINYFRNI